MPKPSTPSVRSKQNRVIRYIYSTDLKTASKHYDVSTEKLKRIVTGNPKRLRHRIDKDPVLRRVLNEDSKVVAKEHKVKLIPKLSGKRYQEIRRSETKTDIQRKAIAYRQTTRTRVRHVEKATGKITYRPLTRTQIQAEEASRELLLRDYSQYTTMESIKTGYSSGALNLSDVRSIVNIWQEHYDFTDERVDAILDELTSEEPFEEVEE